MIKMPQTRTILLIEDSLEDFYTFKRIVEQFKYSERIVHLDHGDVALEYFQTLASNETSKLPALIFLDLNMPGADGREILAFIKTNTILRKIPTIVITTSSNPLDVDYCYNHSANGYLVKPVNYEKFKVSMQLILDYWLNAMTLPG